MSSTASAHSVAETCYTFDRSFAWTFQAWSSQVTSEWNGAETQGPISVTTNGTGGFLQLLNVRTQPAGPRLNSNWGIAIAPNFTIASVSAKYLLHGTQQLATTTTSVPGSTGAWSLAPLTELTICATADNHAPSVPTLATPVNNVVRRSADTNYSTWNASTDPDLDTVTYIYQSSFVNSFNDSAASNPWPTTLPQIQNGGTNGLEPEGTYYWRVKAVDQHGLESAWSTPRQINIDNTSPVISTNISEGAVLGGNAVSVQLNTNEANPKIVNIRLLKNGASVTEQPGYYTQNGSNNNVWTFNTTAVAEGSYTLQFSASDAAGNAGTTILRNITVDNTSPQVEINNTTPAANYKLNSPIGVHAIDDNFDRVELYRIDNAAPADDSHWTYSGAWFGLSWLQDGTYKLVAHDKAGNTTEHVFVTDETKPFVIGSTEPATDPESLTITATDNSSGIKQVTGNIYKYDPMVLGADDEGYYLLDGNSSTTENPFIVDLSALSEGTYYVRYNASDMVGNISNTERFDFTVSPSGQGGGDAEENDEPTTPPAETPVSPPVITAVLAVAQLITGANDGSRVLTASATSQNDGEVQAAETTNGDATVDGAVDEDDQKLVEDTSSVFDYWWIVLLVLIGLFWFIAAKRRKNEE
jgi:hypothetical protein